MAMAGWGVSAATALVLLLSLLAGAADGGKPSTCAKGSSACSSSSNEGGGRRCEGTPVFVLGASIMDVGENAFAMPFRSRSEFPPYGIDYFPYPSRRFSNGRLVIDFITQELGLGLGHPFLQSTGQANFTCGVNFASSGATALNSTLSGDGSSNIGLFSLSVQIDQFREFKNDALNGANEDGRIPSLQDFIAGVYILEFGHNDYINFLDAYPHYESDGNVSAIISALEMGLKRLHAEGAVNIVVMNLLPMGCAPLMLAIINPSLEEQDQYRCFAAFNDLVDLHNARLEELLQQLSEELPSGNWTLFDINSIFVDAIHNPQSYGVAYNLKACCGTGEGEYNVNPDILCGRSGYVDDVLTTAWTCDDPSSYIFWDTLHPVESFAKVLANGFLSGEYLKSFTSSNTTTTPFYDTKK